MWFNVAIALGALLLIDVCHFHLGVFDDRYKASDHTQKQSTRFTHMRSPQYTGTVMPNGQCTIKPEDGLKVPNPDREYTHFIATAINPHYGVHVVVLGRDNRIYHKHQIGPVGTEAGSVWTKWKCLTPEFTKVPCSKAPHCGGYDNFPQMIMQPVNGTLVVFTRQVDDLVPHEMHLTNPKDPDSWSSMRGPTCLCNFPPCANQTKCGVLASCDNQGVDCASHPPTSREFWHIDGPVFPTSELSLIADDAGMINMFFRGFDGRYYRTRQLTAGDAGGKYGPSDAFDALME